MTKKTLPGLTEPNSNCIVRVTVYGCGDNPINPWISYDNRELFKLVVPL